MMYSKSEVANMDESTLSVAVGSGTSGPPSGKAFGEMVLRVADVLEAEAADVRSDGQPVRWIVAHLHNSMPTVALAAERPSEATAQVIARALKDMATLAYSTALANVPGPIAHSLHELRKTLVRHRIVANLYAGNASTELRGDEMAAKVSERETRETGIIEGKLEAISVHDRRVCAIYDPITGERVQGTFGADLIAEVGRLIGHRVCATGEITYKDARAHAIKIEEIRDLAPEQIRSAKELRGIGRNWFPAMPSEDYVRGLWEDDE